MKTFLYWMILVSSLSAVFWYGLPEDHALKDKNAWQQMTLPGELSNAHAFLEKDCSECHTAVTGVKDSTCISCHANDESLLQRQPTAFHVSIQNCVSCHGEHNGRTETTTVMEHKTLAAIGLDLLTEDTSEDIDYRIQGRRIVEYLRSMDEMNRSVGEVSPTERVLNCSGCHSNEDPHRTYFGDDCTECHSTSEWSVPSFQHPSPANQECAQCHAAPPSHYMKHFKMISATVAGKPHADMNECFECHQTTSWNDVKGVGWYKHH